MKKVIIVEGKHDDAFVKVLKPNIEAVGVEFSKLGGDKDIENNLLLRKRDFLKAIGGSGKLGIILDLDDYTVPERLNFLNKALKTVFQSSLDAVNQPKKIDYDDISLEISCFFIKPNLDVLLREIALKPAPIADCVALCLKKDNVLPKEIEKQWVDSYMRYDICNSVERKEAKKNVTYQFTASKNAWNLGSEHLLELNQFLAQFD